MGTIMPSLLPETDHLAQGLEAYVYVLGFQSGLVKVGYSADVRKRLLSHRENAASYGNPVTRQWVSTPHIRARSTENLLISYCQNHGTVSRGREWFSDVSFDQVVSYGEKLCFRRATADETKQHELAQNKKLEALRNLLPRTDARCIAMPAQLDLAALRGFPNGEDAEELHEVLGGLLSLPAEEVRALPECTQQSVMKQLAESWNIQQDMSFLRALLEEAAGRQTLLVTRGLAALRREVSAAAEGRAP
ncbi:GIY-YIG nuclease family protein [Streptomyces parvus]|uniref:GIY-YIG nuclease family protein n=1 Tax=Streptomyces parvus TaxID=66428 RepID=UPI0033DFF8CC